MIQLDKRALRLLDQHQRANGLDLTRHHFAEQVDFYRRRRKSLRACIDSRRAGKTRGGNESDLELASKTKNGRFLYVTETRAECKRLAWHGARGDGMYSLCRDLGLLDRGIAKANEQELWINFPAINSWIYLVGADDEHAITRALGVPWHRVRWDEAQRIPPKFTQTILETLLPALLDYGGEFLMTGTPERKQSGLFYEVTRPEVEKRRGGWDVFHWTLMQNPYWGRAKFIDGQWFVVWGPDDEVHSGPHTEAELPDRIRDARHTIGVLGLQELLGGPDIAPLDSPIMRRQARGEWTSEDSNYVYLVNKLTDAELYYAPARMRPDKFPDIPRALEDLPFPASEALFAMGVDIGWYPDPFAFVVWAWHPNDPNLYELCSWKRNYLTSDEQIDAIKAVRAHVIVGLIVADASNPAKPTVKGWSKEWIERYNMPILEAEKQHKHGAIDTMNTDILNRRVKFRENGALIAEMKELQWATIVSGTGRQVEDPTMANDCCDAGLYGHRHSFQFRWQPAEPKPPPGTPERIAAEAQEIEEDMMDQAGGWQ